MIKMFLQIKNSTNIAAALENEKNEIFVSVHVYNVQIQQYSLQILYTGYNTYLYIAQF